MIFIDSKQRVFHLSTKKTSYVFRVSDTNHLLHLYYGPKLNDPIDPERVELRHMVELGNSTTYREETKPFSLNDVLLEMSTFGKGDYRDPMVHLEFEDGTRVSDFLYEDYTVTTGKPPLNELPHTHPDQDEKIETLIVRMKDAIVDVTIELFFSVFDQKDCIARSMNIMNGSKQKTIIHKAMSFNFDHFESNFEMVTLDGAWIRERHVTNRQLGYGITKIDSKKGVSSSDHNPFLVLKRKNTEEQMGECYGFALVYSGSFEATVEVNPHDMLRVLMGINSFDFKWVLSQGDNFQTPEAILTYSNEGLNRLSQNYHDLIKQNLVRGAWKGKPRPVLINNWEATYFDFNESKLLRLAKAAKKLGVELFVLDDGWFSSRDDDTTSLGDWTVNHKKLPKGLENLSRKIKKIGLDFGIWVEPEMVSIKSRLYENHPDWAIRLPNREPSFGRNQLILDLSNVSVQEYILDSLRKLFNESKISYCKWDMNRNFSDLFSGNLDMERQSELLHRYVLGLYKVLETLTKEFPHILFESCSSGGNRFDFGMLYYMPQTWTSDNSDAVERLKIQYGTSYAYPPSTMGAHVSSVPNHQVLRITPLETRYNVAAFGLLGYELDCTKLTRFERKTIKRQIDYYKTYRSLFQYGDFYRIKSPFEENVCIWMVVNSEKSEAILGYYQILSKPNPGYEKMKTLGLSENKTYNVQTRPQYINLHSFGDLASRVLPISINSKGIIFNILANNHLMNQEVESHIWTGDWLMSDGFTPMHQFTGSGYNEFVRLMGDFGSRIYHIKEIA